ncbi:MAG: metallophosphoesterase family protein [Halanaerobiaceae bacterium]
MKLLHTADWHLGKHLEGYSRLQEQEEFIKDLIKIVDDHKVDMILISGDIYDNFNPPAAAEKLYYRALNQLSKNGERIICIISGNHDSPNRLIAPSPLTCNQGIILMDRPHFEIGTGRVGQHEIIDSGQGYLEININNENVVLMALPYPSESRLNQALLTEGGDERKLQKSYSRKVGEIFTQLEQNCRGDTINIAMSHLFVAGGEQSESERPIQVGGGLTVNTEDLPEQSQYTALGHLHRHQAASEGKNAYYAGSPLQYSISERNNSKSVTLVEAGCDSEADIERIALPNRKPIEVWEVEGIEEAVATCRKNEERPVWAYLKIKTERTLLQSEIKEIKSIKPDILSIIPLTPDDIARESELPDTGELNIIELFKEYYRKTKEVEPEAEVMEMFASIVNNEEDEANETGNS